MYFEFIAEPTVWDELVSWLPLLIPLAVVQIGLTIASLVSVLKRNTYKVGNRAMWIALSFLAIIGPILYFVIGKGDE